MVTTRKRKRTDNKVQKLKKTPRTNRNMVARTGGFYSPSSSRERKFNDVGVNFSIAFGATTWAAPAAAQLLNGLTPGSGATNRIGRKIMIKSIYIRGKATFGAAVTNSCQFRWLLVYDKQANATFPATTDVLLNDDYLSPNNISNKDRFVVIADKVTASVDAAQIKQRSFKWYKRCNLSTQYNAGVAGTIGDITSGSLFLMCAQSGGAGIANPTVTFQCRIRYDDL